MQELQEKQASGKHEDRHAAKELSKEKQAGRSVTGEVVDQEGAFKKETQSSSVQGPSGCGQSANVPISAPLPKEAPKQGCKPSISSQFIAEWPSADKKTSAASSGPVLYNPENAASSAILDAAKKATTSRKANGKGKERASELEPETEPKPESEPEPEEDLEDVQFFNAWPKVGISDRPSMYLLGHPPRKHHNSIAC